MNTKTIVAKRISKWLLIILITFYGCMPTEENSNREIKESKKVSHSDVEFRIPPSWNIEKLGGDFDKLLHVTCWDNDGLNIFTLQWSDRKFDLKDFLIIG